MSSSAREAGLGIVPSIATIREAQRFLATYFAPTRLVAAPYLSAAAGTNVYLKLETELPTGSFKVRGAFYALAQRLNRGPIQEVVACSTGNHGAALADAAKQIAPQVKIIGVQAERAPSYYLSWKEGKVVGTETCDTIADGLATRTPEAANVRDVKNLVDDVVLVSEEQMLRAIETLLLEEHDLAEPAGAASTAALSKSSTDHGENVVLVVSGANISPEVLRRALAI